jgi:hypothetical protein
VLLFFEHAVGENSFSYRKENMPATYTRVGQIDAKSKPFAIEVVNRLSLKQKQSYIIEDGFIDNTIEVYPRLRKPQAKVLSELGFDIKHFSNRS